jgi:hypothetical protein
MLDLLYSVILLLILLLWLSSLMPHLAKRLVLWTRKHAIVLLVLVWAAFLVFSAAYCVYFGQLSRMHDIPNAVDAAIESQEYHLNPYSHNVVPRFSGTYSPTVALTYRPYNYLPFDLDVYSLCEEALGSLGAPLWFVLVNLVFSAVGFFLLKRLVSASWRSFAPVAGMAMLFFSFDNMSLTLMLVMISMYLFSSRGEKNRILAILVMGLAMMTKIQAIIPFGVLVLSELERVFRVKDGHMLLQTSAGLATSGVISAALMVPFGFWNVMKSAVLFHAGPRG